jgi:hypothetical protein
MVWAFTGVADASVAGMGKKTVAKIMPAPAAAT